MSNVVNNREYILNKNSKNNLRCPYCKEREIIKYGAYNGKQRYKCKNILCQKTFTEGFEDPFRYSKKFRENYKKYKELFEMGLSIRKCAEKLNVTLVTAFFWRHKFLYNLKRINYIEKLCDYAELTRMVVVENFKGDRNINGREKDRISIVNGINKSFDIISIIAARNHLGIKELKENIEPRIDKKAITVAFLDGRLQAFSNKHNIKNKIIIRRAEITPIDKEYSLKIKRWLIKFRGVATKYIDHYLSWAAYEYKRSINYGNYKDNMNKYNNIYTSNSKHNLYLSIINYVSWKNIKAKKLTV